MSDPRELAPAALRWLRELGRGALDLVLPPRCASCAAAVPDASPLCERCDRALPRLPSGLCALCQALRVASDSGLCRACEAARGPLDACAAAVEYRDDVEAWIQRFKYPRPGLAGLDPSPKAVVRQWAREAAARVAAAPQLVVPVPLHTTRLRERGFNPAGLLARAVARERARFDPTALRRIRETPSQTGLDRAGRVRNVRGAFRARPRWRAPACVWLVDDVVTTGSTLAECARVLRAAGARQVIGVCAARTPP